MTTESALLATIAEIQGTIRDLRKEIAALRKTDAAKEQVGLTTKRQQELHRPGDDDARTLTQRTQLAQPLAKHSYAEAAQTPVRRTQTQTTVVAKREPRNAGQPVAEKGGYGAVLPARPYRDRDLVETGMTQLAPTTPPTQWPHILKKVLLLGKSMECGVRFGKSYREVLGKTTFPLLQVGVTNRHETYYFSFWDQFKVVGGFGSSRGVDGTILNEVRNLLPGDFPMDF